MHATTVAVDRAKDVFVFELARASMRVIQTLKAKINMASGSPEGSEQNC